jgi:MoxR-like ATPase
MMMNEYLQILQNIVSEMSKTIVGQKALVDKLIIGLLAGGHTLLEGVPGLAKTLAIKTLAKTMNASFSRIQFTPDMLPSDIIGTTIYDHTSQNFNVKKGPIFANFVLADEINRAPAKVQSALLEAMQEKQVTIGDNTYRLPDLFFVMATQNPIEQEGTYQLSEAQTDRFLSKIIVNYPNFEEERQIIRMNTKTNVSVQPVIDCNTLLNIQQAVQDVYIADKIETYLLDIVFATRYPLDYNLSEIASYISIGVSPRASIAIMRSAKACAFLRGREFVIPEDIRYVAIDILRHRIGLSFEALANDVNADSVINNILREIAVP